MGAGDLGVCRRARRQDGVGIVPGYVCVRLRVSQHACMYAGCAWVGVEHSGERRMIKHVWQCTGSAQ